MPFQGAKLQQEGRLSQKDRTTLLVIEHFAKSCTQDHSKRHC